MTPIFPLIGRGFCGIDGFIRIARVFDIVFYSFVRKASLLLKTIC